MANEHRRRNLTSGGTTVAALAGYER
jgi:hypothetical protein